MSDARLLGLDFGSTTSHAIIASAHVVRNCVTGRMELVPGESIYRSELRFTPFIGELLDEGCLAALIDGWLAEAGLLAHELTSGGAIVTGLAAQAVNAHVITGLVRARLGDAVIAVAEDPRLESWLAFMGSCSALSRAAPETRFLNLDIGGGTTNFAIGRGGEVAQTGCYLIGARHVQFVPGGYRLVRISRTAAAFFTSLGIDRRVGDELTMAEVDVIVERYVELLEAIAGGNRARLDAECLRLLEQVRFELPEADRDARDVVITLSGGVGELAYRAIRGEAMPSRTAFGDLGIELALRLSRSPRLAQDMGSFVPSNGGRSTVYGLALHATEVSGTTVHLPRPGLLPLRDLPIVGRFSAAATESELRQVLATASRSGRGACLELFAIGEGHEAVRTFGTRLMHALRDTAYPLGLPLVLFVPRNVGKTIGSYSTDWGRLAVDLMVIDEVVVREARFAGLGALVNGVVPVSFYGMY